MKKSVKWILIAAAAVIVLFLAFALISNYPLLSMSPAKTGQIPGTDIYAVKNVFTTVYFIRTDNGYILIDAGTSAKKLAASMKDTGLDTGDVKWIFLTHSDGDHVAALSLFPNAVIFMGEDELQLINGTAKRSGSGGNSIPAGIDINKIELLQDTQELLCGMTTVECIKAQGHTLGSSLYLVDGKYLFTGDAFKIKDSVVDVHPFTMDAELAGKTIERLAGIVKGSSLVLTAHYGYFDNL